MKFPKELQRLMQNANKILNSQKTSHISLSQVNYGMGVVRFGEKIDCVIMASHCIYKITYACFTECMDMNQYKDNDDPT